MTLYAPIAGIDKALLAILQNEFPLVSEPFAEIATRLGIAEKEVEDKIAQFKASGIIRRIGPVFDAKALGYVSALVAVQVPHETEERAANFISSFEGVTHNYARDNEFNLWFTIVSVDEKSMDDVIEEIENTIKPGKLLRLRSKNVFKIKGVFHA